MSASRIFFNCIFGFHNHTFEIVSAICLQWILIKCNAVGVFIYFFCSSNECITSASFVFSNWYHFRSLNAYWQESTHTEKKKTGSSALQTVSLSRVGPLTLYQHLVSPLKCHRDFLYIGITPALQCTTASDNYKCFLDYFLFPFGREMEKIISNQTVLVWIATNQLLSAQLETLQRC